METKQETREEIEKFLEEVADKHDLSYSLSVNGRSAEEDGYVVEFEYWSDLGEDCVITLVIDELSKEEILHAMYIEEENFDAEEHATEWFNMHGEHDAPTSLRALLKDADEQQKKLEEIYETMRTIVRNE